MNAQTNLNENLYIKASKVCEGEYSLELYRIETIGKDFLNTLGHLEKTEEGYIFTTTAYHIGYGKELKFRTTKEAKLFIKERIENTVFEEFDGRRLDFFSTESSKENKEFSLIEAKDIATETRTNWKAEKEELEADIAKLEEQLEFIQDRLSHLYTTRSFLSEQDRTLEILEYGVDNYNGLRDEYKKDSEISITRALSKLSK